MRCPWPEAHSSDQRGNGVGCRLTLPINDHFPYRNRHCPTCQSLARAAWIEDRTADLLDTQYFHVVFTVPQAIAEIAAQNKAVVYGILFRATADTLRTIAADPRHLGAAIGFFAVLQRGDRPWFIPRISIVSSPAVVSRPMATGGPPVD